MTISGEWTLLKKIHDRISASNDARLIVGIGDDCAVYEQGHNHYSLYTTDISIEGVHFSRDYCSPEDIGYKAMTGNISDIAAMGGEPKLAFVSLGIPDGSVDDDYILQIYDGMNQCLRNTPAQIAGGDVSKSPHLVINIVLYGEVKDADPLLRSTAKPGDTIYVTGFTGPSKAGLELLQRGDGEAFPFLIQRHLRADNRYSLVEEIRKIWEPTAMIDISDGLLSELDHISSLSNVGYTLEGDAIPYHAELADYCKTKSVEPIYYALTSGEEYELLFTSKIAIGVTSISGVSVSPIGTVSEKEKNIYYKNNLLEIADHGYDHFLHKD